MTHPAIPAKQGLYDPWYEHDACGVGFVVDLKGRKAHAIVQKAIQVLVNLEHRGACGCEKNTGDGAGILLQTPHGFLEQECRRLGINLPGPGDYGVGLVFLPTEPGERQHCERLFEQIIREEGHSVLGWRDVPTRNETLGATARRVEPVMRHLFIGKQSQGLPGDDELAFERKLYIIRKRIESAIKTSSLKQRNMFYVPSLSHKTLIYKGMLNAPQLTEYYPDLVNPAVESGLAMVHSRFSTNTFPNWARAHPYRYLCHNGEINTLRGNINWMHARESMFASEKYGADLKKICPVCIAGAFV
ncbi:MAG TPA: hypothetical protein VG099_09010 [Gemmataceae bacterium]|nr:hypothetical protein [Gemmataceae bacterium]